MRSFDDNPALNVDVITEMYYDPADRLTRTVDQRGAETHYSSDGLGRLVRTTDPMLNEVEFDYDLVGNLITVRHIDIEPDGSTSVATTAFEYDERNCRTGTVMPDGSRHTVDSDDRDLAVLETDPLSVATGVEYDPYGMRTSEQRDPAGLAITRRSVTDNDDCRRNVTEYADRQVIRADRRRPLEASQ